MVFALPEIDAVPEQVHIDGELDDVQAFQDAAAVAAALHKRDASDAKVVDFLTAAPGVTVVDSTELDFEGTVEAVLAVVRAGLVEAPLEAGAEHE